MLSTESTACQLSAKFSLVISSDLLPRFEASALRLEFLNSLNRRSFSLAGSMGLKQRSEAKFIRGAGKPRLAGSSSDGSKVEAAVYF
jgi:hypothetical protein